MNIKTMFTFNICEKFFADVVINSGAAINT